jgi:hypothetical protein
MDYYGIQVHIKRLKEFNESNLQSLNYRIKYQPNTILRQAYYKIDS